MKIFTIILYLAISISLLTFYSCNKDPEPPQDLGLDYFPVEQGRFINYEVFSVVWDDFNSTVDTTYYQMKMVIDTLFIDNMNRESYKWIRYTKTDTTDWIYDHTYALTKTTDRVESVEGNGRYIRLSFPVRTGNNWNVNAFNTLEAIDAKYIDVDVPLTFGGESFSQCAVALWVEKDNFIQYVYQEEVYARGIGLVQRTDIDLEKKSTGEITSGYKLIYTVLEYGIE